jgi:hypothetical protein
MRRNLPLVLVTVLIAAILLCSCATARQARGVTIGLSLADIGTTAYAVHHGYDEANPIYCRNPIPRAIVVNFAYIFAVDRATDKMEESQRRYTWEWLAFARALPVLWNIYQLGHPGKPQTCTRTP